ncbi:MAG TPA: transporter [Porphyromonadaceae bacterium]|nr:TolC family protein [Paramuribaculum sp.]HAB40739.1 transporter [Porphyromonadaceae bacterium]
MKRYVISSMVSLAAISGAAQTWTYSDCVEYAREHNISLQKSRLTELSSEYTLEESKAQWEPTLDFATTHSVSNYPWKEITKNSYNSSYGLNAGWTVWNGGQRENTIKQSKLRTEINRLTTGQMMRTLETDLLQVYINILYAKESIGIYKEAAKVSLAQSERARELMEAGKISRVDYAQLNSQYEQDKYALVNAQSTYDSRLMELKQLLELGIETEIRLADVEWDAAQVLAALPPIAESYRMALDTDLRIKALEIEKSSSDLDIAIAKAGRMPKISLNAGVGTGYYAPGDAFGSSMKKGLNESLGLTLSIPIFDNKKTKTAVAQARVANLNAQLDINQRQTDIAQLVENWYIDTQSAQSRYSAAETQLESARLSDELTNERFNLGYVNTVELMTAHNSYIEARHTVLQAKYMAMLGQKMVEFYRNATVTLP